MAPAAAMPPLTTASGRACARRGATRDAPAMATPASAILIVLPQDCGSAGRGIGVSARGERGAGPRRSGREELINSGPTARFFGCRGDAGSRARAGRTLARFSSRFSPGNGGGGIHRDSSVSGPPDTRARTTTQVARPEARLAAIWLPPSRRDLHGARAPEKASDATLIAPTADGSGAFGQ